MKERIKRNTKLCLASMILLAMPCAIAQTAPAAPASAPMAARPAASPTASYAPMGGGPRGDRGSDRDGDRMRFRGPEGPGGDARLLPPGTWWRDRGVIARIGLTADQQKHIDQIFLDSRVQLIHMHATLEEEQLRLDSALSGSPFNQAQALAEIDKIADTRASLEKANAKMLLNIRGVLNPDQWTKLQAGPGPRAPLAQQDGGRRDGGDRRQDWRGRRGDNVPHPSNGAPPPPPAAE